MSLPILSRYVAVSVNCEESYEYSLATGRAKGEAWVQISRQAGTSYRTALWPGGCGGLGEGLRAFVQGQTLVLTLSNPGLRNALDPAIYAAGIEALGSAERNAEVRSVVLTGEGGVFSAGGNLQRLQTHFLKMWQRSRYNYILQKFSFKMTARNFCPTI